ncbi:hypothetical protein ACE1AT_04650 [Pelatocladus sp. BLCC-F211]|uniref:hypothetical protein n=1 Tax=Pelatocladus sp. BLCC-F211 TaxID=3342752 RepID=UPI0035BADCE8
MLCGPGNGNQMGSALGGAFLVEPPIHLSILLIVRSIFERDSSTRFPTPSGMRHTLCESTCTSSHIRITRDSRLSASSSNHRLVYTSNLSQLVIRHSAKQGDNLRRNDGWI